MYHRGTPPCLASLARHNAPQSTFFPFLKPWLDPKALVAERLKKEERLLEMMREKEVSLLRLRLCIWLLSPSRSLCHHPLILMSPSRPLE